MSDDGKPGSPDREPFKPGAAGQRTFNPWA
jgi:hypothetical protein